jgi:hypothetical protein
LLQYSLSGLATSFYNDRHTNIAKDLMELLLECNQPVPDFIQADAEFASGSTSRMGSRAPDVLVAEKGGDWDCPKCGKSNYASRSVCFMRLCQNPRPRDANSNGNVAFDAAWDTAAAWGNGGDSAGFSSFLGTEAHVNTQGGGWGGGESMPTADSSVDLGAIWGSSVTNDNGQWNSGGF